MLAPLVAVLVAGGLFLFVLGAVLAGLGKVPGRVVLGSSAVLEVVVLVQAVWAVVALVGGHHPVELLVFLLYLVGIVVVMPLCVFWSLAERTRWSNLVVAVGGLTVMGMTARLEQLWAVTRG